MLKSIGALALGALFVAAAVPAMQAGQLERSVTMSFSNSVQVPGMVLPAGTYQFVPLMDSRAIEITNRSGTETLGTAMTIPIEANRTPDHVVVRMAEPRNHNPEAVKSWFYPGDKTGYEFVYPSGEIR